MRGVSEASVKVTGTIRAMEAGRLLRMKMVSARLIASERSCVTNTAVRPEFRMICPMSSPTEVVSDNPEQKMVHPEAKDLVPGLKCG